jgi:hypothetical protein
MATPYHLEYLGFKSGEAAREYRLLVRDAIGQYQEFTLVIEQKAFLSGLVRYQDAAEICFWKLQRELTAWEGAPDSGRPDARQRVHLWNPIRRASG